MKRNPMAKVTEVVKEIAQRWKKLDKQDRLIYKEQARKGRFCCSLILKFFKINHFRFTDKERYEKELRALEQYSTNLKKPKKCLSAYMIFVKEVSASLPPNS